MKPIGIHEYPQRHVEKQQSLDEYYVADLEREWRRSLPDTSDMATLEGSPEAEAILPNKFREWKEERANMVKTIRDELDIAQSTNNKSYIWFWYKIVELRHSDRLREVDHQLTRLRRLLPGAEGGQSIVRGRHFRDEDVERARSVPLTSVLSSQEWRKSGERLVGRCPFHEDKTPSFFIYPENSFHCFGCQAHGGNAIDLVKLLHNCDFKTALTFLL